MTLLCSKPTLGADPDLAATMPCGGPAVAVEFVSRAWLRASAALSRPTQAREAQALTLLQDLGRSMSGTFCYLMASSKECSTAVGEFHVGAALVQPEPAPGNRQIEAGHVFGRRALVLIQERAVDPLDVDAAVLHSLGRVGDLQQLAGSSFRVR
jgi:hypothetical protein